MRWQIRTGSRLHFGLLSFAPVYGRRWGGVGLMVQHPGITLVAESSERLHVTGIHADRVRDYAFRFAAHLGRSSLPVKLTVHKAAPLHQGLGTGTQLALAVGRLLAAFTGCNLSTCDLARIMGRGRRSAVGVHGFELGGFIVEGGKTEGQAISPLVARRVFPDQWRVVIVTHPRHSAVAGRMEAEAFAQLGDRNTTALTDRLCRHLLLGMLPALEDEDLPTFAEALTAYNRTAGEMYLSVQNGPYSSPVVAETVERLRQAGVRGVGQSSWGSTVYGIAGDAEQAHRIAGQLRKSFLRDEATIAVTRAMNSGPQLST